MAYLDFKKCTVKEYEQVIYSQDDKNRIKILFNGVEYPDADLTCEGFTSRNRILPNDGNKIFTISNFVAKEAELIMHNIDLDKIVSPVEISIGTLVKGEYEYVLIGKFNIQDTPTTDKEKTTIKLRDNAVKFDFGYNAKPLIDSQGGEATLKQILDDICLQANVTHNITSFNGANKEISIYDDTINARAYIAYIAEQAGAIATINRNGELTFVYINNLYKWQIPLYILEKYEIGDKYKVQRVVYESGIIKYETSPNQELDTLYLDSANLYIDSQEQIDKIFEIVGNFEIDSVTTGKVLGNPAIDGYDLIEVIDDDNNIIFKTLATNEYRYRGNNRNTFETQIGKEARTENVSKNSNESFKKYAKTEIDNLNGLVKIASGTASQNSQDIAVLQLSSGKVTTEIQSAIDKSASDTISTINLSITTQTANAIETWFTSSGLDGTLGDLQNAVTNNSDNLQKISAYIRQGIIDNPSSPYYGESYIELGDSTNQTTLRILPERIQFLTNGVETAYISNNTLYITESTILKKEQIGRWVTEEDVYGNLNTKWVG